MKRQYKDLKHTYLLAVYDKVEDIIIYNTAREEGAKLIFIIF